MSSNDRKHSKNRSTVNENVEPNRDKSHRKSSSKHRGEKVEATNRKQDVEDENIKLEYKYKINKYGDNENKKRVKEENRRRRGNDELNKNENESDKKRRHHNEKVDEYNEEKRHHRRANDAENADRRKSKIENKNEMERSKDKREKDDEYYDERRRHKKGNEDDNGDKRKKRTEDYEKVRHRTEKGDENYETRKHHKRENEENNEKRKTKESKDEDEKGKHRSNKRDEGRKLKESEVSQDGDKRRHRSQNAENESSEEMFKKRRSKEKENSSFDGTEDHLKLKLQTGGDRGYDNKRRGHRESIKENNDKLQGNYEPQNTAEEIDYDDDFDNYDDEEFEDLDEKSPESNEPALTDQSSSISRASKQSDKPNLPAAPDEVSKQTTKIGKINTSFINFKIAQKKYSHDLVANKMLSRAYDLSRLIEMDRVEYDILEMAPVVEHTQYMRLFGKEGCQHEGSQTGSDNIARESQTEFIEERVVWTQCPPLDDNECFQVVSGAMEPHVSTAKTGYNGDSFHEDKMDNSLISILMIPALKMMENIFEEEATCEVAVKVSGSHDNNNNSNSNKQAISTGYSKYSISDGMDCLLARFAVSNSNMFVTVHQSSKQSAVDNKQSAILSPIAVWKVSGNVGEPYVFLSCPGISETRSSISCVTFSPDPAASHIICGLSTGTIALWDLKEYSYMKSNKTCLSPAYITGVSSEENDLYHKGPIVGLQPVNTGLYSSSNSYQLISLDSFAQLFIWMVSAVNQQNKWNLESGSLTDLNLRPGARHRMSRVTSVCLVSSIHSATNSYMVTSVTFDPSRNTHLFCGTNSGQIIQHIRVNQINSDNRSSLRPKTIGETSQYASGAVTQLDFYPFFEPYLLAGYDDGLIQIFAVGKSKSLLSFHYKHQVAILQLKWSRSHPAIFFSFDVEGNLCVWNVLIDLYNPVHVLNLPGYIGFDLSSDSKWQSNQNETVLSISTHNRARLLLWAFDGRIEVHELADAFTNPELDMSFKTCSLLQSLI